MSESKKPSRGLLWLPFGGFGLVVVTGLVLALLCFGACFGYPCFPTGIRHGMWLDECPSTGLQLGAYVEVSGMVRGGEGSVSVLPHARFLRGEGSGAWESNATLYRGVDVDLTLLDDEGEPVDGASFARDRKRRGYRYYTAKLPELPDGDYVLRARVMTRFDVLEVDVDLPLYAPAIAHVMTDRPLYKPGQDVLLRSVTLKRTDLTPLDRRPGRWRITSPDGTEMLVEKDRAGAYGVADATFPLDSRAPIGTWTASWNSGGISDQTTFEVRPFKLPRLSVELTPSARWYGIGDTVVVDGVARYTSGAPVAGAPVDVRLRAAEGRWPIPLDWEEPFEAKTGPDGRFSVEIGDVPPDLIERNAIRVSARVTEAAGEVAVGGTRLVLSKDDLKVEAVTELGNGLVGGFNNRAYLRVSTPDGRPLRMADVILSNPWDPRAPTREAAADEDGVAALQLDPGDPVTVRIPAPPVRVRPLEQDDPWVSDAREIMAGRGLDLAERRAIDAAVPAVRRCGDLAKGTTAVTMGVRVSSSGAVTDVLHRDGALDRCVADAMRRVRFPADKERTYKFTWQATDSLVPSLNPVVNGAYGNDTQFRTVWNEAALEARRCLERGRGVSGSTVVRAHWRLYDGSTSAQASLEPIAAGTGLSSDQLACVRRTLSGLRLGEEATGDAMGTASATLSVPRPAGSAQPGATATTGYELQVTALTDGAEIGSSRLVLPVGNIPSMRLRATPSLASPGEQVTVEMFRGPSYSGDLPEEVWLRLGDLWIEKAKVDEEARSATFTLPADKDGFFHVEVSGARVVIFSQPPDPLSVTLETDRPAYAPGDTAKLTVTTRAGNDPTPAGVGLSGVDTALAQLAPLLGPDDYGRVTVRAESAEPAFGAFDPRALTLGQVQGENAAKAAVLRISQLPMDAAGDERLYTSASSVHDDEEVLITAFYGALIALHDRVRAWEKDAPEGEIMTNDRMVDMWQATLKDLRKQGTPATDAFGRSLTLNVLPDDLLAQVDPRQVVADGTRLPEDVVAWDRFVAEEVGR